MSDPPREHELIAVEPLVVDFTVYYSVLRPATAINGPVPLLIALHGYGQKCKGFARWLRPLREHGILVAVPQGPHQIYMQLEPKKVGFNWLTIYEKERSIGDFLGYMKRLVDHLCEHECIDRSRIFVLGFSQGAAMAYRLAVSDVLPVRGVIACGADLPADVIERLSEREPFDVLLVHGDNDPIVPVSKSEVAEGELQRDGFRPERYRHDEGHTIPEDAVHAIGEWITRQA